MARKPTWPPTVHTWRGQSYVKITLGGERQRLPLGPAGSPEARQEYGRLILELEAGRQPVKPAHALTVAELVEGYLLHAEGTQEPRSYARTQRALTALVQVYGHTEAEGFRARDARVVRTRLAGEGLSRRYCNRLMEVFRRCWRWGIEEHDLTDAALRSLKALAPLRRRRGEAKELPPVRAVEEERVLATLPHLPPIVAAMVRLQLLTGARPGEVCALCPGDLERDWRVIDGASIWLYRLDEHKTGWRGHFRWLPIGPRAQGLLLPFLSRPDACPCFSPLESALDWWLRSGRRVNWTHSRRPRDAYDTQAYDRVIARGCKRGSIQPWAPNQIRHRVLTDVETQHGREDARCVGGHKHQSTTAIYAEQVERAARVIARMG